MLEQVGGGAPKAAGKATQQVEVGRHIAPVQRRSRIGNVLRAACVALHGDEVFAISMAGIGSS